MLSPRAIECIRIKIIEFVRSTFQRVLWIGWFIYFSRKFTQWVHNFQPFLYLCVKILDIDDTCSRLLCQVLYRKMSSQNTCKNCIFKIIFQLNISNITRTSSLMWTWLVHLILFNGAKYGTRIFLWKTMAYFSVVCREYFLV